MEENDNKAATALKWAEILDAFRIIPRFLLFAYGFMVYAVVSWYMALPEPSTQQAALVTTVIGAATVITGFYNNSGRKWDK